MNPMTSLVDLVIIREEWIDDALCAQVGGDDHFAQRPDVEQMRRAMRVCARCDVVAQCLEYALRNNETRGIWGGKSPQQRRQMRREP